MITKEIEDKKELELKSTETVINEIEKRTIEIKINDDKNLNEATELLKAIKQKIKQIEERRTDLVKPLNDYIKNLNNEFRPYKEKAEQIKKILEEEILRYNKIRETRLIEEARIKKEAELKRLKEEQEKASKLNEVFGDESQKVLSDVFQKQHDKLENKDIEISNVIKSDKATTITRKQWTYEITEENQVPREYCSPDHYKIQIAIKNGIREIPGLKIFEKEILVTR